MTFTANRGDAMTGVREAARTIAAESTGRAVFFAMMSLP